MPGAWNQFTEEVLTKGVASAKDWDKGTIDKRQGELAKLTIKIWKLKPRFPCYNTNMWKRLLSPLLLLQILLGLALVVVPVLVLGTASLVVTVPIYLALLVIIAVREIFQNKKDQRSNVLRVLGNLAANLMTLSRGGGGGTHWAILQDLRGNGQFQAQMEKSGNKQVGRLLDERCQRLFSDVDHLVSQFRRMDDGSADEQVRDAITNFGGLIVEYRTIVQEFLQFLNETKGEKETIQEKAPFSTRIHRELADGYDRLMDASRQARDELRIYVGNDWLPDSHLTRFPRAALLA